jgi:hypothetical protein
MRVVSSSEVIESAERIAQKILDTYSEPDKSFGELRGMVKDHAIDLLHDFSQTCRMEQDFAIGRVGKYASSIPLKRDGRGATIKT